MVSESHSPGLSSALPLGNWVAFLGHMLQHPQNWDSDSLLLIQLRKGSVGYWTLRGQHLCRVCGAGSVTLVSLKVQCLIK